MELLLVVVAVLLGWLALSFPLAVVVGRALRDPGAPAVTPSPGASDQGTPLRALTESELETYFNDRRVYPGAVVTEGGVLVPGEMPS